MFQIKFPACLIASAAAAILLLGGCDFSVPTPDPEQIRQQIAEYREEEQVLLRDTIRDPERLERFLALCIERDELISRSTEAINTYRADMSRLNADYHASREAFEKRVAQYSDLRQKTQRQFVRISADMKSATTPDEWKVIASFQTKKLDPRRLVHVEKGEAG